MEPKDFFVDRSKRQNRYKRWACSQSVMDRKLRRQKEKCRLRCWPRTKKRVDQEQRTTIPNKMNCKWILMVWKIEFTVKTTMRVHFHFRWAICRKCTMFFPYVVKGEGYRLCGELEKMKEIFRRWEKLLMVIRQERFSWMVFRTHDKGCSICHYEKKKIMYISHLRLERGCLRIGFFFFLSSWIF